MQFAMRPLIIILGLSISPGVQFAARPLIITLEIWIWIWIWIFPVGTALEICIFYVPSGIDAVEVVTYESYTCWTCRWSLTL